MMIKDGHGTGHTALVDDHGRLSVNANMVTHEQHHSTYHKNLFVAAYDVVLPDTSETVIAFYENTHPGRDYEFYHATISANAAVQVQTYAKDSYTSGGNAITPTNMNIGAGKVATAATYEGGASGNIVLDTAGRLPLGDPFIAANSPYTLSWGGGLVLQPTGSVTISALGQAGDKVTVTITFSRHTAGHVL